MSRDAVRPGTPLHRGSPPGQNRDSDAAKRHTRTDPGHAERTSLGGSRSHDARWQSDEIRSVKARIGRPTDRHGRALRCSDGRPCRCPSGDDHRDRLSRSADRGPCAADRVRTVDRARAAKQETQAEIRRRDQAVRSRLRNHPRAQTSRWPANRTHGHRPRQTKRDPSPGRTRGSRFARPRRP